MAITRSNGRWRADVQIGGRSGKRYRKTFDTKAEAQRWQTWLQNQANRNHAWQPEIRDTRKLSDLVDLWYQIHGRTLLDGKKRKCILDQVTAAMNNPGVCDFTAAHFVQYRTDKLQQLTANTINHHHAYLRAVFAELIRAGHWHQANPLVNLRRLKVRERELSYLTTDQIQTLLEELQRSRNPDVYPCALLCLATGARWSEVETLRPEQIGSHHITFTHTKNGKVRAVPVSLQLLDTIPRPNTGRLFRPCYSAFRKAIERASIQLPRGQLAHVLRHTFASHFMHNGGNVMVLQRILGHQSLTMTMRYAHFAPDHLHQAVKLNPLAYLDILPGPSP